ncbi:MAG: helix-turn-helix domain-containing protein [Eubacterium sp.]
MPEEEFNKLFANRLRYYLDQNNMTQAELAKRLSVSTSTVSDWINGRKSPRMGKVDKMCEIFGCSRNDFISEKPNPYYLNPKTAKIAQQIYEDPDLHALFDAAEDADPKDMQMAAELLRRLKKTNPDG